LGGTLIEVKSFTVSLQTKKYRNDGYDWKMRRLAKNSIREDRMKLKVGGFQVSLFFWVCMQEAIYIVCCRQTIKCNIRTL